MAFHLLKDFQQSTEHLPLLFQPPQVILATLQQGLPNTLGSLLPQGLCSNCSPSAWHALRPKICLANFLTSFHLTISTKPTRVSSFITVAGTTTALTLTLGNSLTTMWFA